MINELNAYWQRITTGETLFFDYFVPVYVVSSLISPVSIYGNIVSLFYAVLAGLIFKGK